MTERIVKTILIITLLISITILIFIIPFIVGYSNVSQITAFIRYFPSLLELYLFRVTILIIFFLVTALILFPLVMLFINLYDCVEPAKTNNGKINRVEPWPEPPKEQKCCEEI